MTDHGRETTPQDATFIEQATLSRAALLQRAGALAVSVGGAGALLSACGSSTGTSGATSASSAAGATTQSRASGTVNTLLWQGYDDPKAAKPLTDQGVKIAAQYVANNDEFITKLRAGGVGRYDIVTPYHGYISALVAADLIQPLDYGRLPSTKSYFPEFQYGKASFNTIKGKVYSAPLVWGDTPLVYRTDLVPDPPASWLDLKDPKFKGKVVMWDDGFGHILLFSKVLFGSKSPNRLTRAQLDQVMTTLGAIKKNAVTIAASHGDAADILARGDGALVTESWAYVAALIRQKGKPAATKIPREGGFAWADSYCIVKNAPNEDGAYAFIDTMISAKGDAQIAGATSSAATNHSALANLPSAQKTLYPYSALPAYFAKLGFYAIPPLEKDGDIMTLKDWNAAWDEFKAS